jgi:hypothetical protein
VPAAALAQLEAWLPAADPHTGGAAPLVILCLPAAGSDSGAPAAELLCGAAERLGLRARRIWIAAAANEAGATDGGEPRFDTRQPAWPDHLGAWLRERRADVVVVECERAGVELPAQIAAAATAAGAELAAAVVAEADRTRRDTLRAAAARAHHLAGERVGIVLHAPTPTWPAWARRIFDRISASGAVTAS